MCFIIIIIIINVHFYRGHSSTTNAWVLDLEFYFQQFTDEIVNCNDTLRTVLYSRNVAHWFCTKKTGSLQCCNVALIYHCNCQFIMSICFYFIFSLTTLISGFMPFCFDLVDSVIERAADNLWSMKVIISQVTKLGECDCNKMVNKYLIIEHIAMNSVAVVFMSHCTSEPSTTHWLRWRSRGSSLHCLVIVDF